MLEECEREELRKILLKKARGYLTTEIVTEFLEKDEGLKAVKRKETVREVPPDLSAIKLLLDESGGDDELSLEELFEERKRLVELILREAKMKKQKEIKTKREIKK